jgi:Fic family protein
VYKPNYTITNAILRYIGVIEAAKEVIDHAPLLPYYEKKFQNEAIVRAVHYGTHIEGNELDFRQAERVMQGEDVMARERDVQEVINYREAMEFIGTAKVVDRKIPVDEALIKKLHQLTVQKILNPEKSGAYRETQVVIRNSWTGEVSFKPPLSIAVPIQIKELITFINTDTEIHPVLKSGIIHYEFVRIHPFVDGNGRVARCLATLILFQENYDIRKFFSLEEYFDTDPANYYRALQTVQEKDGDLTEWLEYYTQGLAIELAKIKDRVERISVDGKLRQKLGGAPLLLSERQLKLIEYIQETGYLQNNAFRQLFPMVSEDTVLNELKGLMSTGLIKKQGKTKAAKYILA